MPSRVFVGNLNFETTRDQIATLFAEAGQVQEVVVPLDRNTGRPRGFAFVEFETEEGASQAIEKFDGHELAGRQLRVNPAQERQPRPRPFLGGGDRMPPSGGGRGNFGGKPKGSRRNLRAKKRSL